MFSPADYAAYSRATGRPYPQDEQERADMYGEVRQFRDNQMRRDNGPGLAANLLGGAAVLGTIAGAGLVGRRFLNNSRRGGVKKQDLPFSSEGVEAVRTVSRPAEVNDAAAGGQKMPSNPVSDSIVQDNADAGEGFNRFSRRADLIAEEASQRQAQNFADSAVETMVEIQQSRKPAVSQQSLEATDTAFDQKVQDLQASVQRNEDLDVGSIDLDSSARAIFQGERQQIADSLREQGITPTPGLIEANMAERFGPQSSKYGTGYTKTKQDMQIYANYGGEFGGDKVVIAGEEFPVSKLKTPYVSTDTATSSESMRDSAKDFVGDVRLRATSERNRRRQQDPELASKELEFANNQEVMNIAAANADMGKDVDFNESVYDAYYLKNDKLASEITARKNYSPLELAQIAGAETYNKEKQSEITANFPKRLQDRFEEGQRVYFEADPMTGEPIPGTQELRSGRRVLVTEGDKPARSTSEYDPLGQSGQVKDIYGVRRTADQFDSPESKPSSVRYSEQELLDEMSRNQSGQNPELAPLTGQTGSGDVPFPGDYETARGIAEQTIDRQQVTPSRLSSVNMSEAVRKAARQRANSNPRGGQVPQELETLRRTMPEEPAPERLGPRSRVSGLPPQQRTLPGVNAYEARQRPSQADVAAEQLESYMSRLQRGRSTPLTSEVVIQPNLF